MGAEINTQHKQEEIHIKSNCNYINKTRSEDRPPPQQQIEREYVLNYPINYYRPLGLIILFFLLVRAVSLEKSTFFTFQKNTFLSEAEQKQKAQRNENTALCGEEKQGRHSTF